MNRLKRAIKDPRIIPIGFLHRASKWIPDEFYLRWMFRLKMGYSLNLKDPKTFNEKLNWLKLNDRNPIYTQMADKFTAKRYVEDRIGKEYIVPCYGSWNSFDEIEFDKLPNQFVLKVTHDSSGVIICKDKASFDKLKAKDKISRSMHSNWFEYYREWVYKNITPRIIADKYLDDHTGKELRDYKFWCFNGVPMYMYCTIKGENVYENFYDMDFSPVNIDHGYPRHYPEFDKPQEFELMKEMSAKLSKDVPFVRVDFFDVEGHIYFAEFTFYDWGGMQPFRGGWDERLGKLIILSESSAK